jgi:hypothetical protein
MNKTRIGVCVILIILTIMLGLHMFMSKNVIAANSPADEIVSYGSGVYYYNCNYMTYKPEKFGKALADFIQKNPDLKLVSLTPGISNTGSMVGYFILFH